MRCLRAQVLVALGLVSAAQGALVDGGALSAAQREAISQGLVIPGQYLARVTANTAGKCEQRRKSILALKAKILGRRPAHVGERSAVRRINYLCLISFDGDELVAGAVGKLSFVQYVKPNMEVMALADPPSWGLNRIDQASLPLSSGKAFTISHTGTGVQIYIIDTGVLASHNQFGGRASYAADYINEGQQADLNGHGTHCAGTAAGATYGVSSSATIHGVKVLSGSGSGSFDGVLAGVQFAVDNQRTKFGGAAAVLSLSLGGGYYQPMIDAVNAASAAGHIVTVAAGNSANDACNNSPAGAGGRGASGGVITVGATTRSDAMASYSSYGSCVDILAPGTDISSSWIGSNSATLTISGTSMATPHVAGVAAALLSKHGMNKTAAVAELFASVARDKISSVKTSPNKLLQAPQSTASPTKLPTAAPTPEPTPEPTSPTTASPTDAPVTSAPTKAPSTAPTKVPTSPTVAPTRAPTKAPSAAPTPSPTQSPTTPLPTPKPTTLSPTSKPTTPSPTSKPTTSRPTSKPTTSRPTSKPTAQPTTKPSAAPTTQPTKQPSAAPTTKPSAAPTTPTENPTPKPTTAAKPTTRPTTAKPTTKPTAKPTPRPTTAAKPTTKPTTAKPTRRPTTAAKPTASTTAKPTR